MGVERRIFFAGEHTNSCIDVTVQGSMATGIAAAETIITGKVSSIGCPLHGELVAWNGK